MPAEPWLRVGISSVPPRPRSCIATRVFSAGLSIDFSPSARRKKRSSGLELRTSSREIPTLAKAAIASLPPSAASAALRLRNFIESPSPSTLDPASFATRPTVERKPTLTPARSAASPMLSNSLPISRTVSATTSATFFAASSIAFSAARIGPAIPGAPDVAAATAPAMPPVKPLVLSSRFPTMAPATKAIESEVRSEFRSLELRKPRSVSMLPIRMLTEPSGFCRIWPSSLAGPPAGEPPPPPAPAGPAGGGRRAARSPGRTASPGPPRRPPRPRSAAGRRLCPRRGPRLLRPSHQRPDRRRDGRRFF
jgi:hypothetical protein